MKEDKKEAKFRKKSIRKHQKAPESIRKHQRGPERLQAGIKDASSCI